MDGEARFLGTNMLTLARIVPCTAEEAWIAVTTPEALGTWFIPAEIDLRNGGRFEFQDAWGGRVTDIEPGRTVTYTADAGGTSTFELAETAYGVRVLLIDSMGPREHPPEGYSELSEVQPGGQGSHWAGVVAGWHGFMDALVRYLGGTAQTPAMAELTAHYAEQLRAQFGATPDAVRTQVITDTDDVLIRRQILYPGEATPWHADACHRFTVVVGGDGLSIEYRGDEAPVAVPVAPGMAVWEAPQPRMHRAVNTGTCRFEEVVTFYREYPGQDPQPEEK